MALTSTDKKEIETIYIERLSVCKNCELYTLDDKGCYIPGSTPCCNLTKGGCGCSLSLKLRSLEDECPHPNGPKWNEIGRAHV